MQGTKIQSELWERSFQIALRAAVAWLGKNKAGYREGALGECLGSNMKAAWDGAMADVRAAHEAGMDQIASHTFAASMALAGIEAAKECALPVADGRDERDQT